MKRCARGAVGLRLQVHRAEAAAQQQPGRRLEAEAADSLRSHFFGLPTPAWLLLGGSFRAMDLETKTDGAPYANSLILMQADLRAGIDVDHWHAAASLGVIANGDSPARPSSGGPNLVAREYWLGYAFARRQLLVRAGRINVPYGVRSIEHTFYVRVATRIDLNDTQQLGVAVAYRRGGFRGELMGIAGNYQSQPDAYRERGYTGYLEWSPASDYAVGVSSLVTHAAGTSTCRWRTRGRRTASPARASRPSARPARRNRRRPTVGVGPRTWTGFAGMLQADVEPWQGLHFMGTGETYNSGEPGRRPRGASGAASPGFSSRTSTRASTIATARIRSPSAPRL